MRAGAAGTASVSAAGAGESGRVPVVGAWATAGSGEVTDAGDGVVGDGAVDDRAVDDRAAGDAGWADWGSADWGSAGSAFTGGGSGGMADVASSPRGPMTPKNGTARCQARSWVAGLAR
ncbi:hypothetical protein BCD48_07695 [Pseudofrankia sp. BMG5.36]|nr:hypothetical protein BCD48_07695 [Pseudofrankia sp. BMG5.36]